MRNFTKHNKENKLIGIRLVLTRRERGWEWAEWVEGVKCMVMVDYYTLNDHFAMSTEVKSSCCILETYIMLHINFKMLHISIKSERQRRKGKIYPSECRLPKKSKERQESLPK